MCVCMVDRDLVMEWRHYVLCECSVSCATTNVNYPHGRKWRLSSMVCRRLWRILQGTLDPSCLKSCQISGLRSHQCSSNLKHLQSQQVIPHPPTHTGCQQHAHALYARDATTHPLLTPTYTCSVAEPHCALPSSLCLPSVSRLLP